MNDNSDTLVPSISMLYSPCSCSRGLPALGVFSVTRSPQISDPVQNEGFVRTTKPLAFAS